MGRELAQCCKLGLVKAVGVSNFNTKQLYASPRISAMVFDTDMLT